MTTPVSRPAVKELMFRLFQGGLHPELFENYARLEIHQPHFTAQLNLCRTGHWVIFSARRRVLAEAICEKDQLLPLQHCAFDQKIRGCRTQELRFEQGLQYAVSFQIEQLVPELFLQMQEELRIDAAKGGLAHMLPSVHRMVPSAISLIRPEHTATSLQIHAFHTFPESCSILRTQSIFELA